VPFEEWTNAESVGRYLDRADEFPRRIEGESVLLDLVPADARRVLDIGMGDGVFANFEHVASPTHRLHVAFFAAIQEPLEHEDPSDRLLDVETQLTWLREIGFDDVDCYWKWLEMALLVGIKPGADRRSA